jgi:FkbM family methyltransferase
MTLSSRFARTWLYRLLRQLYFSARALQKLPLAGFLQYLRYQSGLPGAEQTPIAVGRGMSIHLRRNATDVKIFEQIFFTDDCVLPVADFHPATIIDGGAHIGCATVYFALRYPQARIVAVEAEEGNYRQLLRNVEGNPNIRAVHGAISDRHGWAVIENPEESSWGFHVSSGQEAAKGNVPRVTIPDLIGMSGAATIDLLKLDIEGSEKEVFAADTGWLSSVSVINIELHDRIWPGCTEAFQAAVAGYPAETTSTRHNLIWIRKEPDPRTILFTENKQ